MRRTPGERLLGWYVALVMLFLALPIIIVIPSAFGEGSALTFPPHGFSLRWFRAILDRPARIFHLAWLLPRGLAHLVSPSSPKNANKRADYPRELTRLERRGMLSGPAAYVRARRESRVLGRRRAVSAPARSGGADRG